MGGLFEKSFQLENAIHFLLAKIGMWYKDALKNRVCIFLKMGSRVVFFLFENSSDFIKQLNKSSFLSKFVKV